MQWNTLFSLFLCSVYLFLNGMPVQCEPPSKAQSPTVNLAVSNPTQNSIQVNWEAITGATRYELSYGTNTEATNRGRMFISGTSKILTRLMANTIYYVKVRPIIAGRAGPWSPIIEFSTQIPVITDLEADDVRATSVHLTWRDRYRDLPDIYYEIAYGTDPDATSDGLHSTENNFMTLRNLALNTTYYIKLRVRNPKTTGPWSTPISVTTLSYSPAMSPTGLTVRSGNNSTVILNWNTVAESDSYDIAYGTDPIAENIGIVPANTTSFSFNLSPNTQYYFKVRAVLKGTPGPWSKIKSFLTLPATPRGLNVLAQTSQHTIISWQSLAGSRIARYYHVQWGTDALGTNHGITVTANATYTLTKLKANQKYAVRVRAVNTTGHSNWSKPLTFTTLPATLKHVEVYNIKHTSAQIKWQPVSQAIGYEVTYGSDVEARNKTTIEVNQAQAELRDLLPEVTYYVKVRPLLPQQRVGSWSNTINFTTFPVPLRPKQPSVCKVGRTFVYLTWTALPHISTYEIALSTETEVTAAEKIYTFHQSQAQLNDLTQNSIYFVKLRALNLGGAGAWSDPLTITTLPAQVPNKLVVDNILPTEVLLRWEAISGSAPTSYQIRFAAEKSAWKIVSDYTALTLNLIRLKPNTNYRIQIRAQNNAGKGPWSHITYFKTPTAPPNRAPQTLAVVNISDVSAQLQWEIMPEIEGYRLSVGTDTDASNRGSEDIKENSYILRGLIPDTSYYVKVKAYNKSGDGPWSDIVLLTTRPAPPIVAPSNVRVLEVTKNSLSLQWDLSPKVLRYEVSIGTDPQGENSGDPRSINYPPYIFDNLKPNTTYFVKVRNVNRGGGGPWSRILKITTLSE